MFFLQTEDYLKRKIRSRPERSELVRMHILEGVLDRKCFFMQTLLVTIFTLHHPRFFFTLSRCPHSSQKWGMQSSPPDLSLACIYFHSFIHLLSIYSSTCEVQARSSQTNSACPRSHAAFFILGKERFGLESVHFLFGLEPTLELEEDFPSLNPTCGRRPPRGRHRGPEQGGRMSPRQAPLSGSAVPIDRGWV